MNEYQEIRREYCNLMKWHPVNGDWGKPIDLSFTEFAECQNKFGADWSSWEMFDKELPRINEMIDDIEYRLGKVKWVTSKSIQLDKPILRIAKYKTKNGNQTVVKQFHIPPGNPYDKRITREKARSAFAMIENGESVSVALEECKVRYDALLRHTDYIPIRSDLRRKKIRKAIKLIQNGWKLSDVLSHLEMSSKTFSRWTGGKKMITNRIR